MLEVIGGLFWLATYVVIIRRGFVDKTYGMPLAALCANLSWEFIFTFVYPHEGIQWWVNFSWLILDLIILYQFIRYGRRSFAPAVSMAGFAGIFTVTLATSFGAVLFITREFDNWNGMYAAFGQNLMMSILFVSMLVKRNGLEGQSVYVALFKMLGTVVWDILFYQLYPDSVLLGYCYVATFLFDLAYFLLLYAKSVELGMDPWTGKQLGTRRVLQAHPLTAASDG